jgi:sRNA-binding regulator protein Hfq
MDSSTPVNQRDFIQNLIEKQGLVSVFLKTGLQLKGTIVGDCDGTLLFQNKDNIQIIQKTSIASIYPHDVSQD